MFGPCQNQQNFLLVKFSSVMYSVYGNQEICFMQNSAGSSFSIWHLSAFAVIWECEWPLYFYFSDVISDSSAISKLSNSLQKTCIINFKLSDCLARICLGNNYITYTEARLLCIVTLMLACIVLKIIEANRMKLCHGKSQLYKKTLHCNTSSQLDS